MKWYWLHKYWIGILLLIALLVLISCGDVFQKKADESVLEGTRAVAEEAYIWAYPMLMNYKSMYGMMIEENSPAFRAPFNHMKSDDFTLDHTFKTVVTPNADTPYSLFALDLRAEPQVLSVPAIPDRYYVFQCVDLFTHNFEFIGTRATGSEAGRFLFAGPEWAGEIPEGFTKVLRPETDLVFVVGRTQLKGDDDLPKVVALQEQYSILPLSGFLDESAPAEPPTTDWPTWNEAKVASPDFVEYVNFLLTFCEPLHPTDAQLMKRFAASDMKRDVSAHGI